MEKEESPKSVLVITFSSSGSAELSLHAENVSPVQLIAAAAWLDWYARKQFDHVAKNQKPNLIVPQLALAKQ